MTLLHQPGVTAEVFLCSLQRSSPSQAPGARGPRAQGPRRRQEEAAGAGGGGRRRQRQLLWKEQQQTRPWAPAPRWGRSQLCQTQPASGWSSRVNPFLWTKDLVLSSDACRGIRMRAVLLWLLLPTPNRTPSLCEQQKKSRAQLLSRSGLCISTSLRHVG